MARSVEDILKEQLGNLLLQLSIVQARLEAVAEQNATLVAEKEAQKLSKEVESK